LDIGKHVQYWIDESMEALDTAKVLFNAGKNLESAFFCNLACEKVLKAAFVQKTGQIPPKIHSLKQLAKLSGIYENMAETQKEFLDALEVFKLKAGIHRIVRKFIRQPRLTYLNKY